VRHWCDVWQARYHHPYPFGRRDGVHVGDVLKAVGGDATRGRAVLDAYLADSEKFFDGHPLGKLISQLPRFIAAAGRAPAPAEDISGVLDRLQAKGRFK
jgi:hypothetical protein